MKPRGLPPQQIARWAREVMGNMTILEANVPEIAKANDWIDTGVRGIDYAAVRRGGSDGSAPELAAMAGSNDEVGKVAARFMENFATARRLSYLLRKDAEKLMADWSLVDPWTKTDKRAAAEAIARRSQEPVGAGDCATCGRVVSGSRIDRLRSGRCQACDRYFARNGQERPRALWGTDSTDDVCPNVLTHHGTDRRCGLSVGHEGACVFAGTEVA